MSREEISDEAILKALREQPQIRQRLASLLSVVGDEGAISSEPTMPRSA